MKRSIYYLFFLLVYLSGCLNEEETLIKPVGKLNYTIEIDHEDYRWIWNYYKYNSDTLLVKIIVKDDINELGERIYEYNSNKQLIKITQTGPYLNYKVSSYLYDEEGRLIESFRPGYKFFYDSLDRLIEKRISKSNQLFKYQYDSLYTDRLKYENFYEEGVNGLNLVFSNEYRYNDLNNLHEIYLESDSWMYDSGIKESLEYNIKNQLEKRSIYSRKTPPFLQTEISYFYH